MRYLWIELKLKQYSFDSIALLGYPCFVFMIQLVIESRKAGREAIYIPRLCEVILASRSNHHQTETQIIRQILIIMLY